MDQEKVNTIIQFIAEHQDFRDQRGKWMTRGDIRKKFGLSGDEYESILVKALPAMREFTLARIKKMKEMNQIGKSAGRPSKTKAVICSESVG